MKKSILIMATLFFAAVSVNAQNRNKEDFNLKGERKRVAQGVKSGEITKGEAVAIHKQAKDVKRAEACAKKDGVITKRERVNIAKQDRQLDRTIARSKHNKRDRN